MKINTWAANDAKWVKRAQTFAALSLFSWIDAEWTNTKIAELSPDQKSERWGYLAALRYKMRTDQSHCNRQRCHLFPLLYLETLKFWCILERKYLECSLDSVKKKKKKDLVLLIRSTAAAG